MNHESGMRLALDHLKERGHTNILYVQDAETFSCKRKAAAFIKIAGKELGQNVHNCLFKTNRGIVGGREAVDRIIESGIDFSAIIFGDDTTAIGGMQRLHKQGKKIPEDCAIIGWNNTESKISEPSLTTVDNQDDMIGIISIKMLENLLEGIAISPNVFVDSRLVIREST
jgi:LacI family transcriptional regulator